MRREQVRNENCVRVRFPSSTSQKMAIYQGFSRSGSNPRRHDQLLPERSLLERFLRGRCGALVGLSARVVYTNALAAELMRDVDCPPLWEMVSAVLPAAPTTSTA